MNPYISAPKNPLYFSLFNLLAFADIAAHSLESGIAGVGIQVIAADELVDIGLGVAMESHHNAGLGLGGHLHLHADLAVGAGHGHGVAVLQAQTGGVGLVDFAGGIGPQAAQPGSVVGTGVDGVGQTGAGTQIELSLIHI